MAVRAVEHIDADTAWTGALPYVVIGTLLVAELVAILALNGGHFIYSLDDPYIHLALAENIARGVYGINLSEPSAPSSSILWPFLLVPFAGTAFHDEWPLLLNALSALASVCALQAIVRRAMSPDSASFRWLSTLLVVCAAIGLNLVGLVFTGMEHSLQVLLVLVLAWGLIVEAEERQVSWLLIAAIILGPLVRYESLGPSIGAIIYLGLRGRPALAGALAAAVAVPLIAFSMFLHDLGLGWLPSSVLLKSNVSPQGATPWEIVAAAATTFIRDFPGHPSRIVLIALFVLLVAACRRPGSPSAERRLAVAGAVAVLLHLIAGRYGWFGRYEIYILAVASMLLIYLWRDRLSQVLAALSPTRAAVWIGAVTAAAYGPSLGTLILTPFASGNIYEQQYQMHRLVTEFHDGPVAVNDLGWVSYRNDGYVLDLWGLGSIEAGTQRLNQTPGWMSALTRRKSVDLALIYEGWYVDQIPADWLLLGRLHLGGPHVTAAFDEVAFFATDPAAVARLIRQLASYARVLPAGVRFELTAAGKAVLDAGVTLGGTQSSGRDG